MIYKSNFKELLECDHSFAIHKRNIQYLATEAYKVKNGVSPVIINNVFQCSKNSTNDIRRTNTLSSSKSKYPYGTFWQRIY